MSAGRTCHAEHGIVWPLPPGEVGGDVFASQRPDLIRPRRSRKHAVGAVQQLAQLAFGYGHRVVPLVFHNIEHLRAHAIREQVSQAQT